MRKKDKKAIIALCLAAASCAVLAGCGAKKEETGLLTPQNLVLSDTEILCWDKVKNADFYRVSVNDVEYITEETEYDLFEVLNQYDVKYEVKVMAGKIGKEYEYSDWTAPIEYALEHVGIMWMLTEDGEGVQIKVADPMQAKGKIVIPAEMEGKPITTLVSQAFKDCTGITGVYLPDSATNLEGSIFNGCTNLKRVRFSPHTTKLPAAALKETGIEKITLPEGIEEIASSAFEGSALKEITLPQYLEKIGSSAFRDTPLQEIALPENLRQLGSGAFRASDLRRIKIPSKITNLWSFLFAECKNLTEVILHDNVTRISENVFQGCSSLAQISLPEQVTIIENAAFKDCVSLPTLKLPSGLKELGYGVFRGCVGLQEIEIPDGVEKIYCEKVDSTDLFDDLGDGATFWGCVNLKSVRVAEGNLTYRSEGNCIIRRADETVIAGCEHSEIPNGVKGIGMGAFGGLERKDIYIPASVENISDGAFVRCSKLEKIEVADENPYFTDEGNALIRLSDKALVLGCNKTADLPNYIEKIAPFSFVSSSMPFLSLPNSISEIGECAFYAAAISSLEIQGRIEYVETKAFYTSSIISLRFAGGVKEITNYAFANSNLQEIYLPEGLETIGMGAFAGSSLQEIYLPEGIRLIGIRAFADSSLQKIYLPEGLEIIGECAFAGSDLREVRVPASVKATGEGIFQNCRNLRKVVWAVGDGWIFKYMFANCEKLEEVILEEGLTGFGDLLFMNCLSLKKLVLPSTFSDHLEIIRDNPKCFFLGCINLEEVIFEGENYLDPSKLK